MAKRNKHIALIVIGIAIALIILNHFVPFVQLPLAVSLPIIPFGSTSASPFQCPSDVSFCKVQGTCVCNIPQTTGKVIFRTNAFSYSDYASSGVWISLYCIPTYVGGKNICSDVGSLMGYCPSSSNPVNIIGDPFYTTPTGNGMYVYTGGSSGTQLYVQVSSTTMKQYTSCTMADTTSTPLTAYSPDRERISGNQNAYSGTAIFTVKDSSNLVKISPSPMVYSSAYAGNVSTSQYDINPGDSAFISGCDSSFITYGTYETATACSLPQCNADKTGYFNCTNGKLESQVNYCDVDNGFVCDAGQCAFPLSRDIKLVDSAGNVKEGFSPSESIYLVSKITSTSPQMTGANVKFLVYPYGSSSPLDTYEISNYDFTKPFSISTQITNPGNAYLGQQFYVVVSVTYNGRTIYFGKENQEYSFRIAPSLSCNAQFSSDIESGTQFTLYQNLPATLNIYVSESGQALPVDSISILNLNLNTGSSIIPITLTKKSEGAGQQGTYVYSFGFIPTQTGMLDAQIQVEKSQVTQDCVVSSRRVNPITVTPVFVDLDKYISSCASSGTPITLHVETKDNLGHFLDTEPILKVVKFNSTIQEDITGSLQRTDEGRYTLIYTPVSNFYFQISSSLFASTNTGSVEVLDNCNPVECSSDGDCISRGSDYVCENSHCIEKGGTNWLLYLGIGVGILAFIIVIILILKSKKSKQVYTGFEGL